MDPEMEYLQANVNPVLEPLVIDILLHRPPNVPEFIYEWINKNYLRKDSYGIPNALKAADTVVGETTDPRDDSQRKFENSMQSSDAPLSDNDDEDDLVDELPMHKASTVTRKSISAEAFGNWNKQKDFVPRFIAKSEEQRRKLRSKLTTVFLFSSLEPKDLDIVIGAMEEKRYLSGEQVIKQGEEGNELYVVESGALICTKSFGKGQEAKYLREYHAGELFGELALLYNSPRAANIIAKTNVALWSLDRATFIHIVKDSAMKKRAKYESFLKNTAVFSTVDEYELTKIVDAAKPVAFKAGAYIIKEGEQGDKFYLLESGEAYATKILSQGQPAKRVMEYKKGMYFGELALLKNSPRAASVVAKTDCVCLTLDRHSFKRLLGPLENILKRNAEVYKKYMSKANKP